MKFSSSALLVLSFFVAIAINPTVAGNKLRSRGNNDDLEEANDSPGDDHNNRARRLARNRELKAMDPPTLLQQKECQPALQALEAEALDLFSIGDKALTDFICNPIGRKDTKTALRAMKFLQKEKKAGGDDFDRYEDPNVICADGIDGIIMEGEKTLKAAGKNTKSCKQEMEEELTELHNKLDTDADDGHRRLHFLHLIFGGHKCDYMRGGPVDGQAGECDQYHAKKRMDGFDAKHSGSSWSKPSRKPKTAIFSFAWSRTIGQLLGGKAGKAKAPAKKTENTVDASEEEAEKSKELMQARLNRMFSDRRLKTNINTIGSSPSGIPIYTFRYKYLPHHPEEGDEAVDTKATYSGVMAQDLLELHHSEAVIVGTDGFYRVDYSKIDVDMHKIN